MNVRKSSMVAVRKLLDTTRQMGLKDGVLYILSRLLSKLTCGRARLIKYYIVAQPVDSDEFNAVRPDGNTTITLVSPDSEVVRVFPRPPAVIGNRYASGAKCLSAIVKQTFAGYIWLRWREYDEDEVRCKFVLEDVEHSVWDFDVYVEPKFRLGRTMARLWQAASRYLADHGVQWTFSRISAFNPDSLSAHARLGTVKCESAIFVLIGKIQLSLLSQRPFMHLSLSDRNPPRIRLAPPRLDGVSK